MSRPDADGDLEAPEADAAEQQIDTVPDEDVEEAPRGDRAAAADEGDLAESDKSVPFDEDDVR